MSLPVVLEPGSPGTRFSVSKCAAAAQSFGRGRSRVHALVNCGAAYTWPRLRGFRLTPNFVSHLRFSSWASVLVALETRVVDGPHRGHGSRSASGV